MTHHQMGEGASNQATQGPVRPGKDFGFYFKWGPEAIKWLYKGKDMIQFTLLKDPSRFWVENENYSIHFNSWLQKKNKCE